VTNVVDKSGSSVIGLAWFFVLKLDSNDWTQKVDFSFSPNDKLKNQIAFN